MNESTRKPTSQYVSEAPKPMGLYPHSRSAGNLLFLSGIGPRNPETDKVPEGIEAQCHAVFKNVRTVLEASGARWDQLIDVTVFLTDIDHHFDIYNKVYREYFEDNPPCRTTVGVTGLPSPIDIELKCIAWLG
jgi:2-aminomuconate deaminase